MSAGGTIPEGAQLADLTRSHLIGWRIPEGVPLEPTTAIVPDRPGPEMVRTASRTLHTILVRTCPDTVILLGVRRDGGVRPALIASGTLPTADGEVGIDVPRAIRITSALGNSLEVFTGRRLDHFSDGGGLDTIPVLLGILAPGCRVVPFLLSTDEDSIAPREAGRILARLFLGESVVLVAGTELSHISSDEGADEDVREALRVRDAAMIRPLLDLDEDSTRSAAEKGGARVPAVLEAAIAHARASGAEKGHLIEYARSETVSSEGTWIGRAGLVF